MRVRGEMVSGISMILSFLEVGLKVLFLSHIRLFVTPGPIAHQAPLSMTFSRQECWSGLPCPPPRDLPYLGIDSATLTSPALAGKFFTTITTWEA